MLGLLRGNPEAVSLFKFNSFSTPNSIGHWLMAGLLTFLDPFIVTKLMVTMMFVGFVAALTFLRVRTAPGQGGVKSTMLIGTALSFNWLWLVGFYNFIIGAIFLLVATAVCRTWISTMNFRRCICMLLLLLITYFSHIVSLVVLIGCITAIAILTRGPKMIYNCSYLALAMLPIAPLLASYNASANRRGTFTPVWRSVDDLLSLRGWIKQIRTADSFILISRNNFPFVEHKAAVFALFTPLIWIFIAFLLFGVATLKSQVRVSSIRDSPKFPFLVLFVVLSVGALFAPDDFGTENGGVLRERILLFGLALFTPIFHSGPSRQNRLSQIVLVFVIGFQTTALWEYALKSDRDATEFFSVRSAILPNDALASVSLIESQARFSSVTEAQRDGYLDFRQKTTILDNYELGYELFPVVLKEPRDRNLTRDLASSNLIRTNTQDNRFRKELEEFSEALSRHHQRIGTLIMWGRNPDVEAVVQEWFDSRPYFERGRVRLFRHKGLGSTTGSSSKSQ